MVESIAESFGQRLIDAKNAGETTFLSTPDGFLYAFVEEPKRMTPKFVTTLMEKGLEDFKHIVILCTGNMAPEVLEHVKGDRVSVVQGDQFDYLLHALGVVDLMMPPAPPLEGRSTLPTATRLDKLMHLGKDWMDLGVPALAARFYGEAVTLKPEYVPAHLGAGEAYLALGMGDLAQKCFDTVLSLQEGNMQARVAKARLHGLHGRIKQEIDDLESILKETPGSAVVRAHLIAALVEAKKWDDAISQVDALIKIVPTEGRFHAMRAACNVHLKDRDAALKDEDKAIALGLSREDVGKVYSTMHLPPHTLRGARKT
jgi:tetratricopeptide (TPR) repeat protein